MKINKSHIYTFKVIETLHWKYSGLHHGPKNKQSIEKSLPASITAPMRCVTTFCPFYCRLVFFVCFLAKLRLAQSLLPSKTSPSRNGLQKCKQMKKARVRDKCIPLKKTFSNYFKLFIFSWIKSHTQLALNRHIKLKYYYIILERNTLPRDDV